MSADIIADSDNPQTVHHLVAYWWNKVLTNYRRNACYEVPGLTAGILLAAVADGNVETYDLTQRKIVYDFDFAPEANRFGKEPLYGVIEGSGKAPVAHVDENEAARRNTLSGPFA